MEMLIPGLDKEIEDRLSGPGLASYMLQQGYDTGQVSNYLDHRGYRTQINENGLMVSYSRSKEANLVATSRQTSWLNELE